MLALTPSLEVHKDERGNVREMWRESWTDMPPIKQMVRSWSRSGVIRGMHYHKRQWDVWTFVEGIATVQLYNPRTEEHRILRAVMSDQSLVIPPGIAHGFQAMTDLILVYGLTEEYDRDDPDEFGFNPVEGWVGAPAWMGDYIISERDRNAPVLYDFIQTL